MNLLDPWNTPFGLAPFDAISDADFAPAMDAALAQARSGMQAIAKRLDAPSFENTIEAQEVAEEPLNQLAAAFYTLASTDSTPLREELQRDFAPKLSAYASAVTSNVALFARIEDLWSRRASLGLSPEQERVLMLTRRDFIRAGAKLTGAEAARMAEIKSRLASLGTSFMQNLLAMKGTGPCHCRRVISRACLILCCRPQKRRGRRRAWMGLWLPYRGL